MASIQHPEATQRTSETAATTPRTLPRQSQPVPWQLPAATALLALRLLSLAGLLTLQARARGAAVPGQSRELPVMPTPVFGLQAPCTESPDATPVPGEPCLPIQSFTYPTGIAVDAQGTIYVTDTYRHRVLVISSAGRLLAEWGRFGPGPGEFRWPSGITVDMVSDVYVADTCNHRIQKLSP